MTITIYGLQGHANRLQLPLESLDIEELAPGEEFTFNGKVYEIRSVAQTDDQITINVSLILNQSWG